VLTLDFKENQLSLIFTILFSIYACVNHARISSWNQLIPRNDCKVSSSRLQREPLRWLGMTTDRLRVRRCVTSPL